MSGAGETFMGLAKWHERSAPTRGIRQAHGMRVRTNFKKVYEFKCVVSIKRIDFLSMHTACEHQVLRENLLTAWAV